MDMQSIYIANGTGIFILLMLQYTSRTKIQRRQTEDRLYSFMVYGVMIACFCEMISYILDGKLFPGARLLNYLANTYLYSVNLLLPFCVMVYVDIGLYHDEKRIWKRYKPQMIIGVIMFSVNIVNFFYPVSYYITELNVYERRPLSYVYYLVILYYCISGIVVTRQYKKKNGEVAFFNIHVFLLPILAGAGLQFLFYGLSLAWLSAAVGLVGLFMMQQNEMTYIDSLTGIYNRQYLNHILSAWIERGHPFMGVMIDIDDFKKINDTFGHSEGDHALIRAADALRKARRGDERIFRFAGDEFVVLCQADAPKELEEYMSRVGAILEEDQGHAGDPLHLSHGISRYGGGSIDAFMKDMDTAMYRMKAAHHHLAPAAPPGG